MKSNIMIPYLQDDAYTWSEWIILLGYVVLGIIGAVGNGFILHVIRRRKLWTTPMILIANQAVSDLSCGLIYLSLWAICSEKMVNSGITGLTFCEIAYTIKVATFIVSSFTMAVISVDRFRKLCYFPPKDLGLSAGNCIVLIWIAGLAMSVLCMFHFRVVLFFTSERLVGCRLTYKVQNTPFFELHYNFLIILPVCCFCPMLIEGCMYYRIIRTLKERNLVGAQVDGDQAQAIFNQNKKRTVHMLISTLLFYYLLCGPIYANFIISYFIVDIFPKNCGPGTSEPAHFIISYFLSVTSICVNPIIYCYYNSEFRAEAKRLWNGTRGIPERKLKKVVVHKVGTENLSAVSTNSASSKSDLA